MTDSLLMGAAGLKTAWGLTLTRITFGCLRTRRPLRASVAVRMLKHDLIAVAYTWTRNQGIMCLAEMPHVQSRRS